MFWTFDGEPGGVVSVVFSTAPAAQGSFHEHTTPKQPKRVPVYKQIETFCEKRISM